MTIFADSTFNPNATIRGYKLPVAHKTLSERFVAHVEATTPAQLYLRSTIPAAIMLVIAYSQVWTRWL